MYDRATKNSHRAMRTSGGSYAKIAAALSISENTVKSYCRRNNNISAHGNTASNIEDTSQTDDEHVFCKQCGNVLTQEPKKKPRRFCSKSCCAAWWARNPNRLNKKATYSFKCARGLLQQTKTNATKNNVQANPY